MNGPRLLSAPGKAFLAGEYAVLEPGNPGLVLAIDRRLSCEVTPLNGQVELVHRSSGATLEGVAGHSGLSWESEIPRQLRFAARAAQIAFRLCSEEGRAPRGFRLVFLDDLSVPGPGGAPLKLGLGGSAGAAVLAVRATCAAQDRPLRPDESLALAEVAHWVEQGGSGSGGDVAAAALGGALEVRSAGRRQPAPAALASPVAALMNGSPIQARRLALPEDARFALAWSGSCADTRSLIAAVRRFGEEQPDRYRSYIGRLASIAAQLAADLGSSAREESLQRVRDAAAAMAALGDQASAPVVTPALARICALASSAGCAAKPSGAGGGDCAILLCYGDSALARALALLAREGFFAFPATLG